LPVPAKSGHCRARTRTPWWPSLVVFPSKGLQLHQQRWLILRVDSLAFWKIINDEDAVLFPPKRFCTRNFLGRSESLCRYSIDCCFVPKS
jgi:hypothetical protein